MDRAERVARVFLEELFRVVEHGDSSHRQWLREKLEGRVQQLANHIRTLEGHFMDEQIKPVEAAPEAAAPAETAAEVVPAPPQKPSIGRVVHYQAYGTPGGEFPSVPRAAVVTEVGGEDGMTVGLCVLNPQGLFFNQGLKYAEPPKPGCWSWPPRV